MNANIRAVLSDAGEILRRSFREGPGHAQKERFELVTEVDIEIEELLAEALRSEYPEDGLIGEELGRTDGASGSVWIVDPIDGTTNFVMGKPYFAVSIARERDGEVVEGYVYNPISEELFHSSTEEGRSFLNGDPIAVSQTSSLSASLIAFGFSANLPAIQRYHDEWRTVFETCRKGVGWVAPALTLCNVARGRIDAFIDFGASMMGQAAASLILRNAGGTVLNYDLSEYDHRSKGIVGCTPSILDELRHN